MHAGFETKGHNEGLSLISDEIIFSDGLYTVSDGDSSSLIPAQPPSPCYPLPPLPPSRGEQ